MAALTVGIIGMVLVLIAYILNQLGKMDDEDVLYDVLNFVGALLLLVYALSIEGWPFLILNLIWGTVAGYDLYKRFRPKEKPVAVQAEAKAEAPAAGEKPKEEKPKEEKVEPEPPKEIPVDEKAELTERRP